MEILFAAVVLMYLAFVAWVNMQPDPEWENVVKNAVNDGSFWSLLD